MIPRTNALTSRSVLICSLVFLLYCFPVFAQERSASLSRAAAVLDSMPQAKRIGEVALSHDGSRIAYLAGEKLAVIPASGGAPRAGSVPGDLALRDVPWSTDSRRIAFIADLPGDVPAAQVWVAAADGSGTPAKHA